MNKEAVSDQIWQRSFIMNQTVMIGIMEEKVATSSYCHDRLGWQSGV